MTDGDRRGWRRLLDVPEAAWLALALALRLALAWKFGDRYIQADEHGYEGLALSLARTGGFSAGGAPIGGAPVPAGLFAAAFLFSGSKLAARAVGAVAGTLAAFLVGRTAAALTRSRDAGRLALALACVYPFFIYYSALVMSETGYIALTVPALALLGLGAVEEAVPRLALGGFLLGLAALARAEAAPIGVLVLGACALAGKAGPRLRRGLAAAALCWLLPILAWCARNRAELGVFALDTHGGMTLLHGTMLFQPNEIDTAEAMRVFEKSDLAARTKDLPEAARDKAYMAAAFRWMAENPGRTAAQWARKAVNFWRFYPRAGKVYQDNAGADPAAGARRWELIAVSLLFEPALILGGFAGLWLLRGRRELWPHWAFLLGTTGVHVFSVSQMRYRLPVMPVLILGAAFLAAGRPSADAQSVKR